MILVLLRQIDHMSRTGSPGKKIHMHTIIKFYKNLKLNQWSKDDAGTIV